MAKAKTSANEGRAHGQHLRWGRHHDDCRLCVAQTHGEVRSGATQETQPPKTRVVTRGDTLPCLRPRCKQARIGPLFCSTHEDVGFA